MRTTFQELQDLFHLKDTRQLKVGLVNKIKVIEDDIEVTDAKVANLIEKFRNGGSLTIKEVCQQYNIALSELNYLVKVNKIPYYKLVSQKGSQMLFLRSDLENENVLNLFIYKGINSVKFVKLVLKLIDEIEGISDRDKTLLTLHFVEGKTFNEIAKNVNRSKENMHALIKRASVRLLNNFRYLNSEVKKVSVFEEKYWEQEKKVYDLQQQVDFLMDQLNIVTPISISLEKINFLKTKIIDFDFSVRVINCLHAADIDTVSELLQYSCSELSKFRNLGTKSLNEIKDLLKKLGYELKE
jgi:hypothetical protein